MTINPDQLRMSAITIGTIYTCPPTVSERQVVYQTGAGTADTADCTGPAPKGPSIGVVIRKPTSTSCVVVQAGLISGFPASTFIAGETLFMGVAGAASRASALPTSSGTIVQEIGYAKSDTELMVSLDRDWYSV